MPKYTSDLLKECLESAGANINEIIDTTNVKRDMTILFTCSCGKSHEKTFHRIVSNGGAFCAECTQKNSTKKGDSTREEKLTDEEKLSKQREAERLEEEERQENKRKEWRNTIVENHIVNSNMWYPHPTYQNYEANAAGFVRNTDFKNRLIKGTSKKTGRITFSVDGHKNQFHRFIMECMYGTVIPEGYDVDHIDKDASNNKFKNLQILTKKEHADKTAKTCPERGKKGKAGSSKKILCNEIVYASVNEAARANKITRKPIWKSIQSGEPDSSGRLWSFICEDEPDLAGELWVEDPEIKGIFVSNMGRIENRNVEKPYRTYGSISEDGYRTVSIKATQHRVHTLVCRTFNGPRIDENMTADHINRNRQDNSATNLRWESKSGQARNRSTVREMEVYDPTTYRTIKTFSTARDISTEYDIHEGIVSDIANLICRNNKMRTRFLTSDKTSLSVRYKGDLNEKRKRELNILEYDLEILRRDKNKRKTNPENLPIHVVKQGSRYRLTITFRGNKITHVESELATLIRYKEEWINEQVRLYRERIMAWDGV